MKLKINGNMFLSIDEEVLKCNIENIEEDEFSVSIEKDYFDLDFSGKEIEFRYYEEGRYYYEFTASIKSNHRYEEKEIYVFSLIKNIKKIQRRNYVRVNLKEYLLYKKADNKCDEWKMANLIDLSGGGVKVKIRERLEDEEKIYIKMCYNDKVDTICGEIVRSYKKGDENIYGIEFIDMDERKRDKIVEKVFKILRKQRELV